MARKIILKSTFLKIKKTSNAENTILNKVKIFLLIFLDTILIAGF